jgi:hypothetical protein
MEKNSILRRNAAAIAGVGLIASPLIALANPALAATADCTAVDPSATEVLPDICEVQYLETGEYTFTAPAGVTKLSAVIVGGGGARETTSGNYAGGGGAVVYVSQVDASAPVDVVVGIGAQSSSDAAGSASSVNDAVAAGGFTGTSADAHGGDSGNGNAGGSIYAEGGGGGAGAAGSGSNGGIGLQASAVANDSAMWPAVDGEPYYGSGGNVTPMVPGYGVAGDGADGSGQRDYGMDGLVILRWTTKANLPATGVDAGAFAAFAAAVMIPGAALLALAARGRRTRAQG